jgi:RecJ-like exonuclease
MVKSWDHFNKSARNKDFQSVTCPQCGSKASLKVDTKEPCEGCKDQGSPSCKLNSCEKTVFYQTAKGNYSQKFYCSRCNITFTVYRQF